MRQGRAGKRQAWFLAAGILALTGIVTVRLIAGGTRGAEIATDLTLPLGVLALLVAEAAPPRPQTVQR